MILLYYGKRKNKSKKENKMNLEKLAQLEYVDKDDFREGSRTFSNSQDYSATLGFQIHKNPNIPIDLKGIEEAIIKESYENIKRNIGQYTNNFMFDFLHWPYHLFNSYQNLPKLKYEEPIARTYLESMVSAFKELHNSACISRKGKTEEEFIEEYKRFQEENPKLTLENMDYAVKKAKEHLQKFLTTFEESPLREYDAAEFLEGQRRQWIEYLEIKE